MKANKDIQNNFSVASNKVNNETNNISQTTSLSQKANAIRIIVLVLLGCLFMAVVDIFITTYVWKSFIKIIFFLGLPFYFFVSNKQQLPSFLVRPSRKQVAVSLFLGLIIFFFIIASYFIAGPLFDFTQVVGALESNVGVTKDNFVFVSIYISLMNSLLEESFFRGFAYLTLRQYTSNRFASLFSAAIFALYHVAIMSGWFSLPLLILLIASLVIAGVIFNFIVYKTNTILSSWFVHMFANIAINVIGFMLFGII